MHRLYKIALAGALGLVGNVGTGLAADAPQSPGICADADSSFSLVFYLAGASAPQNVLTALIPTLLNAGFTTVYSAPSSTSTSVGGDYRAWCGTLKAAFGGQAAGAKVKIIDRARNGSGFGTQSISQNKSIAVMSFAAANCNTNGLPAGVNFICKETGSDTAADPANKLVTLGVSDVPPEQFQKDSNFEFVFTQPYWGNIAYSPTGVTKKSGFLVIFAPGATKGLFDAVASYGAPANQNVTTLSQSQIANMMSGAYSDWNHINANISAPAFDGSASDAGLYAHWCRRTKGSGTQAVFNNYFLTFPCTAGNIAQPVDKPPVSMASQIGGAVNTGGSGTQADPYILDPRQGAVVVENLQSSDLRDCLQKANNRTDHTQQADDGTWFKVLWSQCPAGGCRAWGNVGTDSTGSGGDGTNWKFLSVDTVAPTQQNAQAGLYSLAFENSFQYKAASISAAQKNFADALVTLFQREVNLRTLLTGQQAKAVLAQPIAGACNPATSAFNPDGSFTNSCFTSKWTRGGNACAPVGFVY